MAAKKQSRTFEDRFFDQLEEKFDQLKDEIKVVGAKTDKIGKSIQRNNRRLGRVESAVFPKKKETIQQLPPIWRDAQIIKLATLTIVAVIVFLVIFAGIKGISLPKGLF